MKKGRFPKGSAARYIFKADNAKTTAPASAIELPTKRAEWLRLVRALRKPEDQALLDLHRAAWQAHLAARRRPSEVSLSHHPELSLVAQSDAGGDE